MARLPVYESQAVAQGPRGGSPRLNPGALQTGAGELAAGVQRLARGLGEIAQRQQESAAAVEAAKIASDAGLTWHKSFLDAQQGATEDGSGFLTGVLGTIDEDIKARLESAPELARPLLERRFAAMRESYGEKAQEFAAGLNLAKQARDLNDTLNLNANRVRTSFDDFADAIGLVEGSINGSALSPSAKAKQLPIAREAIARAALQGLNERDPEAAQKWLAEGAFDRFLSADAKHQLVNDNEVELRRLEAKREQEKRLAEIERKAAVAELREEARFAIGAIGDGIAYAGLDDLMKRARAVDPKTATMLDQARRDLGWAQGLGRMPPADIAAEVDRARQAGATSQDPMLAAAFGKRAEMGERLLARAVDGLRRDPLGWAEAHGAVKPSPIDPTNPDTLRQRRQAVIAVGERYGLGNVPLLKPQEAEQIVAAFNAAGTPAEKLDLLSGYTLALGDDAMARGVVQQLQQAKLPDTAIYALELARDPVRRGTAKAVLSDLVAPAKYNIEDKDLATLRKRTIGRYVDDGIGHVLQQAYQLTGNAAYEARMQRDVGALDHIAKVRASGGIEDPVTSSYRDLFGHVRPISDAGLAQILVPADADADRVQQGLQVLRDELSAAAFNPIKEALQDKVERRQIEAVQLQTQRRGVWVNDGDGYVLIVPGARSALAVDGQVRRVTLADILAAAGRAQQAAPEPGTVMP